MNIDNIDNLSMGWGLQDFITQKQKEIYLASQSPVNTTPPDSELFSSTIFSKRKFNAEPSPNVKKTVSLKETKYPWADSENSAIHNDRFLTNPKAYGSAVKGAYNSMPDQASKNSYAKSIASFFVDLNTQAPEVMVNKFKMMNLADQGFISSFIWPASQNWFYINYFTKDLNGFLKSHLTNLKTIPWEGREPTANHIKELITTHLGKEFLEKASAENQQLWFETIEPEALAELQIAQANVIKKQELTKVLGFGALGVFVIWGFQKALSK